MLKLYRKTIYCGISGVLIGVIVSYICERVAFSYGALIQNFFVGIACSLLVVIITTLLQYHFEHHNIFKRYKNQFHTLCFHLSLINADMNNKQINLMREWLDNDFRSLRNISKELCWFSPKKQVQQTKVFFEFECLYFEFEKQRFNPPDSLINCFIGNEHLNKMLNYGTIFFTTSPKCKDNS